MAQLISASINLSKIDKTKIKKVDKNGNPFKDGAMYYELTISVNDDFDQYKNNVQLYEPQSKEQRDAKEKRTFIGNGRVVWASGGTNTHAQKEEPKQEASSDDLPF